MCTIQKRILPPAEGVIDDDIDKHVIVAPDGHTLVTINTIYSTSISLKPIISIKVIDVNSWSGR